MTTLTTVTAGTTCPEPGVKMDITGQRFGRLVAVAISPESNIKWICQCDCGNRIVVWKCNLGRKNTRSCGCLRNEVTGNRARRHGMRATAEYRIWCGIKSRCRNRKHYFGRGIKVCRGWSQSFKKFFEDMGPRPSAKHSIDRIDNNGDYEPNNCRWATRQQQMRNSRANVMLAMDGETLPAAVWAERYGIQYYTLQNRLHKCKWDLRRALTTPERKR